MITHFAREKILEQEFGLIQAGDANPMVLRRSKHLNTNEFRPIIVINCFRLVDRYQHVAIFSREFFSV